MSMEKRTFLKISSAVLTGTVLSPLMSCSEEKKYLNWAGNFQYSTGRILTPQTLADVQDLIRKHDRMRVLGTRHSFNSIADSKDNLLSLQALDKISVDKNSMTVTVGSGVNYGRLSKYLFSEGLALHNLASLPHISVAGACATATHGSGVANGNLATAVVGLDIVKADGELWSLTKEKNPDEFRGAVVGLGALGAVSQLTLKVQPTFMVRQDIYENLPTDQLKDNFDAIMSAGYSVSLFTDWQSKTVSQVWIKSRVEEGVPLNMKPEFFGAKAATRNMHPITALSAENCTDQMGVPGSWHERLPHFKMDFMPSSGVELQSEYFVPRAHAYEALLAVEELKDQITPNLLISEIRTIDADDLWMSTAYKQPSMAIHFTWKQDWPAVSKVLPKIEEKLLPFGVRAHWGKLFTLAPSYLQAQYDKMSDFRKLVNDEDPKGKFRNEFVDAVIFGS
jgi:xylitol oxidase